MHDKIRGTWLSYSPLSALPGVIVILFTQLLMT